MTTTEAAKLIGCDVSHVRTLIASKKLKAKKVRTTLNRMGYVWNVDPVSARQLKKQPNTTGYPRGKPRK